MSGWLFWRGWSLVFMGFHLESALDCQRAIGTWSFQNNYKKWTRQWAHWRLPSMMISLQVRTATKPWRERIFASWAEFHALLQTFLFALGTWRHSGFKYKQDVKNYCNPDWRSLVDTLVRCNPPCWEHRIRQLCWSESSGSRRGWPVFFGSRWVSFGEICH